MMAPEDTKTTTDQIPKSTGRHGAVDLIANVQEFASFRVSQPAGSYTAARMETAGTFAVMLIEFL